MKYDGKIIEVSDAVNILNDDGVVGIPTETVYGLAAKIESEVAVRKIFEIKKRPFFDPLIVHVNSIEMAKSLTSNWDHRIDHFLKTAWPGPLTIVFKRSKNISDLICSGLETVGIRIPNNAKTLELISKVGPLAAPSANKFGRTSPTSAEHVLKEFDGTVFTIDGGTCEVGIESTIISLEIDTIKILRKGIFSAKYIEEQTKIPTFYNQNALEITPGALKHHYMPDRPFFLIIENGKSNLNFTSPNIEYIIDTNVDLLTLKDQVKSVQSNSITFEMPLKMKKGNEFFLDYDPKIAARRLYAEMRKAASSDCDFIYCRIDSKLMESEDWVGIIDRLKKAAVYIVD